MSTRRLDKRAAAVKPELKRAGSSIESQSADLECSICMTAYRAVRLRPCGHASSCALCTLKLIDAKSRRIQCPLCKAHAKQLEWVGLPVVTSAEELPVTLSAGAASLTLSVACVEAPAPPPPLVRLDTFSKAPAGEATTVVAFVRHAAMAPSAEDGLNAEASRLLESWAGAPQVKEDLHFAAAEGDLDEVRRLLDEGRDPNGRGEGEERPIHRAMEAGAAAFQVVLALRAAGASCEETDEDERTPLHAAAASGALEAARFLRSEGPQPPRLRQVLRPAFASIVHRAEAELRVCIALCRGEAEQPPRLRKVLRPALASIVHQAEVVLRLCMALRRGEAEQPPRLSQVFQPAHTSRVQPGKFKLPVCIASRRCPGKLLSAPPAWTLVGRRHGARRRRSACLPIGFPLQQLQHVGVPSVARAGDCGSAARVFKSRVGASAQQYKYGLLLALGGGAHQRSDTEVRPAEVGPSAQRQGW